MDTGHIEYAHAKGVESALRASVAILNKMNPVLDENIPAYLPGVNNKKNPKH